MIRTFLAALLLFCSLATFATAAPPDDPGRDSAVTDSASVSHASVTLDDSAPSDAPAAHSPMLASVGLLGVAAGSLAVPWAQFRKKPVVIAAKQYNGPESGPIEGVLVAEDGTRYIETLEGRMVVSLGDWVITGLTGERYPCKPHIFDASYESAGTIPAPPPVAGYRQLTPEDVALMNETKAAVNALGAVLDKLAAHPDTDKRAVAIAKTEAQTAGMWAVRAVTKPSSFA